MDPGHPSVLDARRQPPQPQVAVGFPRRQKPGWAGYDWRWVSGIESETWFQVQHWAAGELATPPCPNDTQAFVSSARTTPGSSRPAACPVTLNFGHSASRPKQVIETNPKPMSHRPLEFLYGVYRTPCVRMADVSVSGRLVPWAAVESSTGRRTCSSRSRQ